MCFIEKVCDSADDRSLESLGLADLRDVVEGVLQEVNPVLEFLGDGVFRGSRTLDFRLTVGDRTAVIELPFTRATTRESLMYDLHPDNLEFPADWQWSEVEDSSIEVDSRKVVPGVPAFRPEEIIESDEVIDIPSSWWGAFKKAFSREYHYDDHSDGDFTINCCVTIYDGSSTYVIWVSGFLSYFEETSRGDYWTPAETKAHVSFDVRDVDVYRYDEDSDKYIHLRTGLSLKDWGDHIAANLEE